MINTEGRSEERLLPSDDPRVNLEINSVQELKFVSSDDPRDFFILLKHNLIARKRIFYDEVVELFLVEDFVTGEEEAYTVEQLRTETNIMKAIEKGSFFLETTEAEAANLRTSLALFI